MQRTPTCSNCQRIFGLADAKPVGPRIPLLLQCGHTFCEKCLMEAVRGKNELTCTTCQAVTQLEPPGELGVKNLMPNVYVLGLLLYNMRVAMESESSRVIAGSVSRFCGISPMLECQSNSGRAKELSSQADDQDLAKEVTHICEECGGVASCYCSSCSGVKLCDPCFRKIHKSSKLLSKHQALSLAYTSNPLTICPAHPGRPLEFFDEDLQENVCALCTISEKCRGHNIVPVAEMSSKVLDEVNAAVAKAKDMLTCLDHSEKVLRRSLCETFGEASDLFQEISVYFSMCHSLLQNRQLHVMTEAADMLRKGASVSNMLQEISGKAKGLQDIIKEHDVLSKDPQVMRFQADELLSKVNRYLDLPCLVERNEEVEEGSATVIFSVDNPDKAAFESFGSLSDCKQQRFRWKSINDVEPSELEEIKAGPRTALPKIVVKENDLVREPEAIRKTHALTKEASFLLRLSSSLELVYVTHIENPHDFRVQRLADSDRLQLMMTALNQYYHNSSSVDDHISTVNEGEIVSAQYSCDNNWYRARVIRGRFHLQPNVVPTWENGLSVFVMYIDYGNTEWRPLCRLRRLKSQFLEVPEMSVLCSLCDIVPPLQEVSWSESSVKAFKRLISDRPMLMNLRCRRGGKLCVDLRRPDDGEEPNPDDERPISVRDALVFLDAACFVSPASNPNDDLHRAVRSYIDAAGLSVGTYYDVGVTHIIDPHNIYIQMLNTPIAELQKDLTKLYRRNKNGWTVDCPHRNFVCAAKFSEDQTWYRAVVENVNSDDTVLVRYVDYGNCERLPFRDIKRIPGMYLRLPRQAVLARLYDVEKLHDEERWSLEVAKKLGELILMKPLVARVAEIVDGVPSVMLYDTSTKIDLCINKLFVQEGFARSSGLSASSVVPERIPLNERSVETPANASVPATPIRATPIPTTGQGKIPRSYLPPEIPDSVKFEAIGVYVDRQATVFIYVVKEEGSSLSSVMDSLNSTAPDPSLMPSSTVGLYLGQPCVAKFSQDDTWYRVKISSIVNEDTVMVDYVDFGNSEAVKLRDLRLQPSFMHLPEQCLPVRLHGVAPNTFDGVWSEEAITLIADKVQTEIIVEIKRREGDVLQATILIKSVDQDLGDLLVLSGFAKMTDAPRPADAMQPGDDEHQAEQLDFVYVNRWYTQQCLPKPGVRFDVRVTNVFLPNEVHVQRCAPSTGDQPYSDDAFDDTARQAYESLEHLEHIQEVLNSPEFVASMIKTVQEPIEGMPCCCQYTADGLYYRAKLESVDRNSNPPSANVRYVDYGTSEVVPLSSLKRLPNDFLELPMQSTRCTIAGLQPCDDGMPPFVRTTKWPQRSVEATFNMCADRRMVAQVIDSDCVPIKIHLYDRMSMENSETGEYTDVLVGQVLANQGLAKFELDGQERSLLSS